MEENQFRSLEKLVLRLPRSDSQFALPIPLGNDDKDFTIAIPIQQLQLFLSIRDEGGKDNEFSEERLLNLSSSPKNRFIGSFEASILLIVPGIDSNSVRSEHEFDDVRCLLCFMCRRAYLSVTLRLKTRKLPSGMHWDCKPLLRFMAPDSDYAISRRLLPVEKPESTSPFIFTLDAISNVVSVLCGTANRDPLSNRLVANERKAGLVILAGATKCCKTEIAKGLCLKYLYLLTENDRPPKHFITFEDPIEQWGFTDQQGQVNLTPIESTRFGVWFTPRERRRDAVTLKQACFDALRQTPACFFIGEIRDPSEWSAVTDLAASGHLVVTTTHAGSLTETFTRLFGSTKSRTAATRALIANALLGVLHVKGSLTVQGYSQQPQVFGSFWRSTTQSVATLISDGISSICPDGENVLGRYAFASLVRAEQARLGEPDRSPEGWASAFSWAANEDLLEG